jgi:hypothetical protein
MGQLSAFHLGAITRTFPYITPKSVLARLAYCKQPSLRRLITEAFWESSKDSRIWLHFVTKFGVVRLRDDEVK